MTASLVAVLREGFLLALLLAAPILVAAVIAGILTGLLTAFTQIQDPAVGARAAGGGGRRRDRVVRAGDRDAAHHVHVSAVAPDHGRRVGMTSAAGHGTSMRARRRSCRDRAGRVTR